VQGQRPRSTVQGILGFSKIRSYNYGFLISMLCCNPKSYSEKYSRTPVDIDTLPNHVNLCLNFLLLFLFLIPYYLLLLCTITRSSIEIICKNHSTEAEILEIATLKV